jgi:hypothetical protein
MATTRLQESADAAALVVGMLFHNEFSRTRIAPAGAWHDRRQPVPDC